MKELYVDLHPADDRWKEQFRDDSLTVVRIGEEMDGRVHHSSVVVSRANALVLQAAQALYKATLAENDLLTPSDEAVKLGMDALDKAEGATVGTRWEHYINHANPPAPKPETDRDARELAEQIYALRISMSYTDGVAQIAATLASHGQGESWTDPETGLVFYSMTAQEYAAIWNGWEKEKAEIQQGEMALRDALEQAAQSLEAIGRLAGKDETMLEYDQVRGYALNRAMAARAALREPDGRKGE